MDEKDAPTVIQCKYEKGQAILSGIYFEADRENLLGCALPTEELANRELIYSLT